MQSLKALEWEKIQEALASRCKSQLGIEIATEHVPFSDPKRSQTLRSLITEGLAILKHAPIIHDYLSSASSTRVILIEYFGRSQKDGVLEPEEVFRCGRFMETVGLVALEFHNFRQTFPLWSSIFAQAPQCPDLTKQITRSVSSDGMILDTASHELASLRRQQTVKKLELEALLETKLRDWHLDGLLQDRFYDIVDGRYVVPVKTEFRSKLQGVFSGRSNTGQSVYIEPAEVTAQNNALKEINILVEEEEFRILQELSQKIASQAPSFLPWVGVIAELDLSAAAARLAIDWQLNAPKTGGQELKLLNLFHPLLKVQKKDVVTNTLVIKANHGRALLISGPNTGGKTVLLKSAGLATAMASAGLFVAAEEGSIIPDYQDTIALIGDDQNLEEGLSSFSAQILMLMNLLSDSRAPLFIVIDEILSSTDPEEASALAQAILESLVDHGHHILITSHFSDLSKRALTHDKIRSAAMEFQNGHPTFRLRPDELGASHALEISKKLGLSNNLLDRAKELLSKDKLDYQRLKEDLKKREQELEKEFSKRERELEAELLKEKKKHQEEMERFIAEARTKLDETVARLSQTKQKEKTIIRKHAPEQAKVRAKQAIAELQEQAQKVSKLKEVAPTPTRATLPKRPFRPGDKVRVQGVRGSIAVIIEIIGNSSDPSSVAILQMGHFKIQKLLAELTLVER